MEGGEEGAEEEEEEDEDYYSNDYDVSQRTMRQNM